MGLRPTHINEDGPHPDRRPCPAWCWVGRTGGEYDHLVPLDLGGANASSNLWLEPGPTPNPKDAVEQRLHEAVETKYRAKKTATTYTGVAVLLKAF